MPVVLVILLNFLGWLVVSTLVVGPLDVLKLIKFPAWLLISVFLILFFWYFGE
jgi:purine-cytosine permease-like protein